MTVPPTTDEVRVDRDGPVLTITLDRPADQNRLTRDVLAALQGIADRLAGDEQVQAVVIPRTQRQAEELGRLDFANVLVPAYAVDAQSLIAYADLVVSAGGTMNREAVALGVPVYTTFGGRLGGVDEALIREKRLIPLSDPRSLDVRKRDREREPVRRDPALMLELLLSTGES